MRKLHIAVVFFSLLVMLSASACTGARSGSSTDEASDRNQSGQMSTVCAKDFDSTNFDNSTTVETSPG